MGCEMESEPYRMLAATTLKNNTDSIFKTNPNATIVIMGDFNDEPTNNSLLKGLNTENSITDLRNNKLYNLTAIASATQKTGSHKYKGSWAYLDQFIVSGKLLNQNSELRTSSNNLCIFNAPFLLEKDDAYLGDKPFRTFVGYKYNGGYSDHLPLFIDLNKAKD